MIRLCFVTTSWYCACNFITEFRSSSEYRLSDSARLKIDPFSILGIFISIMLFLFLSLSLSISFFLSLFLPPPPLPLFSTCLPSRMWAELQRKWPLTFLLPLIPSGCVPELLFCGTPTSSPFSTPLSSPHPLLLEMAHKNRKQKLSKKKGRSGGGGGGKGIVLVQNYSPLRRPCSPTRNWSFLLVGKLTQSTYSRRPDNRRMAVLLPWNGHQKYCSRKGEEIK